MTETRTISQLIRDGAKLRPQCFGGYYKQNDDGVWCSCVLGAIAEAVVREQYNIMEPDRYHPPVSLIVTRTLLPTVKTNGQRMDMLLVECPVDGCPDRTVPTWLNYTMAHLNDTHMWTREAIATWLETQGL